MAILLFDNYDSFTYNLHHYLEAMHQDVVVVKNDAFDVNTLSQYTALVISPGPGLPAESGCLMETIDRAYGNMPILGVCLGMQALAEHTGHTLYNLEAPLHGVARCIQISESMLFNGLPRMLSVGLYHSWAVNTNEQSNWSYTAYTDDGILMAMENPKQLAFGVQFHPESILTQKGRGIMQNFLNTVG